MRGLGAFEGGETALAEWNLPHLAPETLEQIRRDARALHDQWEQVPPGGCMELLFETRYSSCVTESDGGIV